MNRRQWALAALAALIAVDLVLIYLVLRPSRVTQVSPATLPPAEVAPSVAPTTAGVPQDDVVESAPPVPANMLVLRTDGSLAMAEGSTCAGPLAEVWLLNSGSTQWESGELPGAVIMRFDQLSGGNIISVSTPTAACAETWFRTAAGTALVWGPEQVADGVFYLRQQPDGSASVATIIGEGPSPCSGRTIALAAREQQATVACDNGEIFTDGGPGNNWVPVGTLDQIRAIAFGGAGLLYAANSAEGCNGLAIWQSTDGGSTWQRNGCAELADSYSGIGLAANGNDLVLVDTNRVPYRSTDAGRTLQAGS